MLTGSVFQLFGVVLCYKMGSLCGSFGVSQSASIILSNKMCVNTVANTAWVPGVCASVTVLTFFSRPASSVWMPHHQRTIAVSEPTAILMRSAFATPVPIGRRVVVRGNVVRADGDSIHVVRDRIRKLLAWLVVVYAQ